MTTNAETVRLAVRLCYHDNLIDRASTGADKYVDAAGEITKTILALCELIRIDSVPGNEWERFHTLRQHCYLIDALLLMPTTEREEVRDKCTEAIEQLCYLMAFDSIGWTGIIETLCLRGGKLGQRQS